LGSVSIDTADIANDVATYVPSVFRLTLRSARTGLID
jgi:hypothetical protein